MESVVNDLFNSPLSIVLLAPLTALMTVWLRKHPNVTPGQARRVRVPLMVPMLAWCFVVISVIWMLNLPGYGAYQADVFRWLSVLLLLFSVFLLIAYRNWYIEERPTEFEYRTVLGKVHTVPYNQISSYRFRSLNWQKDLIVKGPLGERLVVNVGLHDLPILTGAVRFHELTGRWPDPGEKFHE